MEVHLYRHTHPSIYVYLDISLDVYIHISVVYVLIWSENDRQQRADDMGLPQATEVHPYVQALVSL